MALARYVLTQTTTVPAGAYTSDVTEGGTPGTVTGTGAPANFGTGSWAQRAGHYESGAGTTWYAGQLVWLDPAGKTYAAIGAPNLAAPARRSSSTRPGRCTQRSARATCGHTRTRTRWATRR
jgi:hypothetical protein